MKKQYFNIIFSLFFLTSNLFSAWNTINSVWNKVTILSCRYFSDPNLVLMNAVRANNLHEVTIALSAGADANACDAKNNTALMCVTRKCAPTVVQNVAKVAIVKKLLDAGADVNIVNEKGTTALIFAVTVGIINSDIVKMLIDAGADVNAVNNDGWTALMKVSYGQSNQSVVKMLIDAGANVDAVDNEGTSVFGWAIGCNNEKLVKYLLTRGCNGIAYPQYTRNLTLSATDIIQKFDKIITEWNEFLVLRKKILAKIFPINVAEDEIILLVPTLTEQIKTVAAKYLQKTGRGLLTRKSRDLLKRKKL